MMIDEFTSKTSLTLTFKADPAARTLRKTLGLQILATVSNPTTTAVVRAIATHEVGCNPTPAPASTHARLPPAPVSGLRVHLCPPVRLSPRTLATACLHSTAPQRWETAR